MPPTLPAFLQALEFIVVPYPQAAVEAALARREESVPSLLQAIDWATDHLEEAVAMEYLLPVHALYLLAEMREARALPVIVRLFRHPEHENLTGDISTGDLSRILASTYGGDLAPIQGLIEDDQVGEYVRSAAVEAFAVLAETGLESRATISAYFGELFGGRLEPKRDIVWDGLVLACLLLRMTEHLPTIREFYQKGIVDDYMVALEEVEREIATPIEELVFGQDRLTLIDDAAGEMGDWLCFDPDADVDGAALEEVAIVEKEKVRIVEKPAVKYEPNAPVVRSAAKIGRNERCPCGSGLKYKNCCGKTGGKP